MDFIRKIIFAKPTQGLQIITIKNKKVLAISKKLVSYSLHYYPNMNINRGINTNVWYENEYNRA